MKALLFICSIFFVCIFINATPSNLNSGKVVNSKELPDLSQDKDFVKAAIEIYSIQSKIIETNSSELITRASNGTLTDAEKNMLASNLGYTDYAALNNSFNSIGKSILGLKNKYTELNDQAVASSLINASVTKLGKEGKINVKSATGVCFWQLLCAIVNCIHTSCGWADFHACLCAAYAQYVACNTDR